MKHHPADPFMERVRQQNQDHAKRWQQAVAAGANPFTAHLDVIRGEQRMATARAKRVSPPKTSRPRARGAGRPARRTATRSSARSGDSGDEPASSSTRTSSSSPPASHSGGSASAAARAAVARTWTEILRERHPGTSWEVVA